MKVAICDDVRTVCSQLERYILEFQAQKATKIAIEVFYTGEELIDCLRKGGSFDLIFLDIELDHINGVEVGHIIRKERKDYITKIVYISGKDHYYRELLEVQTFHFLSKPLEKKKVFEDLSVVAELLGTGNHMFSFMIKRQNHSIPINEILYFESKRRQVKVVSTKGTFVYYANLQQVSHAVAAFRFIQPHTSYLVNFDHILRIGKGLIVMYNGDQISVSRDKKKEVYGLLTAYEEGKGDDTI